MSLILRYFLLALFFSLYGCGADESQKETIAEKPELLNKYTDSCNGQNKGFYLDNDNSKTTVDIESRFLSYLSIVCSKKASDKEISLRAKEYELIKYLGMTSDDREQISFVSYVSYKSVLDGGVSDEEKIDLYQSFLTNVMLEIRYFTTNKSEVRYNTGNSMINTFNYLQYSKVMMLRELMYLQNLSVHRTLESTYDPSYLNDLNQLALSWNKVTLFDPGSHQIQKLSIRLYKHNQGKDLNKVIFSTKDLRSYILFCKNIIDEELVED